MDTANFLWGKAYTFFILDRIFPSAMFGAFVLYILNVYHQRHPFSCLTALQVPLSNRPWMILFDMILSSFMGATIVMILTSPGTPTDAFLGGLGFTGLLIGAIKTKEVK